MTDVRRPSDVASAYDRWSEVYDADRNRTRDRASAAIREQSFDLAGRTVVEIGCGTGLNTEWLAARAARVVATDFSRGMLAKAQARVAAPTVQFVEHDLRTGWPMADASVDLVVETLVLEHVERLEHVFVEAARVTRPGGELFVAELHPTRQLHGRQAEFADPSTGKRELVTAYVHDVSDFVNGGVRAGFEIAELGEWRDPGAASADLPRLLTVRMRRR